MPETAIRPKTILLPCPCCGEADANIAINLGTLEDETFTCQACNGVFTDASIRDLIARWQPILAWLDTVPSGN